jgi:hypothetical protein
VSRNDLIAVGGGLDRVCDRLCALRRVERIVSDGLIAVARDLNVSSDGHRVSMRGLSFEAHRFLGNWNYAVNPRVVGT